MAFGTIEQAIEDIKSGKMILVADDEDRENEGDLICAASLITRAHALAEEQFIRPKPISIPPGSL